jgi:hypothetical protein
MINSDLAFSLLTAIIFAKASVSISQALCSIVPISQNKYCFVFQFEIGFLVFQG